MWVDSWELYTRDVVFCLGQRLLGMEGTVRGRTERDRDWTSLWTGETARIYVLVGTFVTLNILPGSLKPDVTILPSFPGKMGSEVRGQPP